MLDKNHERNATIKMVALSLIFFFAAVCWQIETNQQRNAIKELQGFSSSVAVCPLPSVPTTPIKLYRGEQ